MQKPNNLRLYTKAKYKNYMHQYKKKSFIVAFCTGKSISMHFNATINMSDRKACPLKQCTFEKTAKNLKEVAKLVFMKHKLSVFIFNEENFPTFFMLNPFIPNESK